MNPNPHPTYPLQHAQRQALFCNPRRTPEENRAIYDRLRDKNFPGWRERYDAEMKTWAEKEGQQPKDLA